MNEVVSAQRIRGWKEGKERGREGHREGGKGEGGRKEGGKGGKMNRQKDRITIY